MSESYTISAGASLTIDVTLRDDEGGVVADYDGTQTLLTTVWAGGRRAVAFSPTTSWTDPAAGTIAITIADDDTAVLEPGRYSLLTRLDDAGATVDLYRCDIVVTESSGTVAARATYCSYDDLLTYGRSWLKELATDDDEAGFAEQRARAREWLDDLAQAHNTGGGWWGGVAGVGVYIGPGVDTTLKGWLDADGLIVTGRVREMCAKYALYLICAGQVGVGDAQKGYGKLAAMYKSQSDAMACGTTLGIDTNADQQSDWDIDLSYTMPLFG